MKEKLLHLAQKYFLVLLILSLVGLWFIGSPSNLSKIYHPKQATIASQGKDHSSLSAGDKDGLEGLLVFTIMCTVFAVGIARVNRKRGVKWFKSTGNFNFDSNGIKQFGVSYNARSQDYSSSSSRCDDSYHGINSSSGLPLRSSGSDIAGNPIGSNYTSPSYTGYRS